MDSSSAILMQRISVLEDLMRRSEGNVSQLLTRLRDTELAVSNVVKVQEKSTPEMRYLFEEVTNVKKQLGVVDQSWRQTYSDFSGSLQQEIRGRIPQQIDALTQQLRHENNVMKQEVQDMQQTLRRVTDQWNADQHDVRQVAQTTSWKSDQLQTALTQLIQQHTALERRVDTSAHDLRGFATEVERNAGSFRQFVESAVRAAHSDLLQRVEMEQRARDALQADVQITITKLRDDVVRGLAHSSATCRVLEENVTSLETVLRAEVRSRMQKTDEIHQRLQQLSDVIDDDATQAAEVIQGLDADGGSLGVSVRRTQAQLDALASQVESIKTSMAAMSRGSVPAKIDKRQQRAPSGSATSDSDPTLGILELEEDEESDDEGTSNLLRRDGGSAAVVEKIISLAKRLRSKASVEQLRQLKEAMYISMCNHVQLSFADMAARLEKDQGVLEKYLAGLKEQLRHIEARYQAQEKKIEQMGSLASDSPRGHNANSDVEDEAPHSGKSSVSQTPRSARSDASAKSESNVPLRASRPPSENPNVMKKI